MLSIFEAHLEREIAKIADQYSLKLPFNNSDFERFQDEVMNVIDFIKINFNCQFTICFYYWNSINNSNCKFVIKIPILIGYNLCLMKIWLILCIFPKLSFLNCLRIENASSNLSYFVQIYSLKIQTFSLLLAIRSSVINETFWTIERNIWNWRFVSIWT